MKKVIIVLFVLYAFVSCKKDTSNSSNTNSGTPSYIYPTSATSYYGTLTITKSEQINFPPYSNLGTNYFCNAFFSSSPQTVNNYTTSVSMDSVLFNNVPLTFDTNFIQYYSNSPHINGSLFTWHVAGKNGIHSFTFSNNSVPVYTNYNLLPDTLDHTKALTLPIHITNLDTILVSLGDRHSAINQTLLPGSTSVTFPLSAMSQMSDTGLVIISGNKSNVQSVYNKAMNFNFKYEFQKQVYIK
ncbi:MAG TPA: hypothetical protein VN698_06105 [Bacteroidia bacterium]|nr:hypothetical protein [Bacteroidia bacterium]